MMQVLCLRSPTLLPNTSQTNTTNFCYLTSSETTKPIAAASTHSSWTSLQRSLKCDGKYSCLFSDNKKQEQARKALESALGEKKDEFEKWDKEIQRREEFAGGGNSGKGGWFGWSGWSGDDSFWPEAQTASLTVLAILALFLVLAKGDVMIAVIFNPLLFALRGTRTGFAFLTSKFMNLVNPNGKEFVTPREEVAPVSVSAKDRVVGKWGSN